MSSGYDPSQDPMGAGQSGGYGQGGMGNFNPMRMLMDFLFGGPQAMMQDLMSLSRQAPGGYNYGNQSPGADAAQAPWLAQGRPAPRGTNPYLYPAAPAGSRFVPGRGLVDRTGATLSPQSGPDSGKKTDAPITPKPVKTTKEPGPANATGDVPANTLPTSETGALDPITAAMAGGSGIVPSRVGSNVAAIGTGVAPDQQSVARSVVRGSDTRPTAGFSPYLRNQRASAAQELRDPNLRLKMAAMLSLENSGDPIGPAESLFNRSAFYHRSIASLLSPRFYGSYGSFGEAMARLQRNPREMAYYNRAIDTAASGSNVLAGATDQGSARPIHGRWDPNARNPSGRIIRSGEVYNDHVPAAANWRREQQRRVMMEMGAQ
jgi:hypothetical protein